MLTSDEIAETLASGTVVLRGAKPEVLIASLSSWSPLVRKQAAEEMRRRGLAGKANGDMSSANPLERVAAIELSKDFGACARMLGDSVPSVQLAALGRLKSLHREKGFEAIMQFIAKHGVLNPVLTQAFAEHYFPIHSRAKP